MTYILLWIQIVAQRSRCVIADPFLWLLLVSTCVISTRDIFWWIAYLYWSRLLAYRFLRTATHIPFPRENEWILLTSNFGTGLPLAINVHVNLFLWCPIVFMPQLLPIWLILFNVCTGIGSHSWTSKTLSNQKVPYETAINLVWTAHGISLRKA